MSQNDSSLSSHADQPPDIEELLRQVAQAREQAVQLGKGGISPYGESSLEDVASMLARVEDTLRRKASQDVPVPAAGAVSASSSSASTSPAGSGAVSTSTSTFAQAPQPLQPSALPENPVLGGTTQADVPTVVSLNLCSEPTFPANPLTFNYLWKLWGLQAGIAHEDVPKLEGKFVDLHAIALTINSLGGQAEILRDPSLWKRLAFKLRLISKEDQDDQYSKLVIDLLQKTQRVLLGPFEQYCIDWNRLSEAEMNQRLAEYAATTKSDKSKIPCYRPFGNEALPIIATEPVDERADKKPDPAALEGIGRKLLEAYFLHFYPGIPVKTKIDRLLKMTWSQAQSHSWTRAREDWLAKFQRDHAGRDVAQVTAHLTKELMAIAQQRVLASIKGTEIIAPHSPGPPESGKPAVQFVVTRCVLFSTELVRRANGFVEETIQKIEDLREFNLVAIWGWISSCDAGTRQKRIDVPESDRKRLRDVVISGYGAALSFYHTVALHYMLYQNEKTTRTFMMQASRNILVLKR